MSQTDHLSMPFIMASQAQKHVTHNEALLTLDAILHLSVLSRTQNSAPATPNAGDRYLIPSGASGDFAGQDGKIAAYQDGIFQFYTPQTGWLSFVADEAIWLSYQNGAWTELNGLSTTPSYSQLGVNATADSYNRLSVTSDACLFNHNGSNHQVKINKNAATDTASLLFQTGYSGRAEFGLAGDDLFRIKTSTDGSTFETAMTFETDHINIDRPFQLPQYSIASLPVATMLGAMIYVTDATSGPIIAFCDGTNWRRCDDRTIVA